MEPSTNPDQFLADLENVAMKLYHPGSRPHPVEWVPDPKRNGRLHLGVSFTVKNTAADYAKRIIRQREDPDVDEGFWGEQGNALADHHLRQITPYRENQVRMTIPTPYYNSPGCAAGDECFCGPGWDFIGHFDGATLHDVEDLGIVDEDTDFRVMLREHKLQDADDGEPGGNVDSATRQGITYCAIIDRMFDEGLEFCYPSDLMTNDCRLMPLAPTHGLVLHFWPRTSPPARVMARKVEKWEKAKWLDFYVRKAQSIIKSVRTYHALVEKANADGSVDLLVMPEESAAKRAEFEKDALSVDGGAYEWDDSPDGVQEFKRTITAIQAGLPTGPFRELVLEVANAKKSRDQWDVLARDREASAIALMVAKTDPKTGEPVRSVMVTEDDGKTEVARATVVGGNGRASWLKVSKRGV